jgi:hypothetical protein
MIIDLLVQSIDWRIPYLKRMNLKVAEKVRKELIKMKLDKYIV